MIKYFKTEVRLDFLKKVLCINSKSCGVDLGCGAGYELVEIQKISPDIFGVDIRENKTDLENYTKLDFFKENLPFKNLDFIYCLSPYFGENWWNIDFLMKSVHGSLKQNGVFLLDLFDFYFWKNGAVRVDDFLGKTKKWREDDKILGERVKENGDIQKLVWRIFTVDELVEIARKNGFKVENIYLNFKDFKGFSVEEFMELENKVDDKDLENDAGNFKRQIVIFRKI